MAVAVFGSVLVADPASAERTVRVPEVLTRSAAAEPGLVRFTLPATFVALSWDGPDNVRFRYRPLIGAEPSAPWGLARESHDLERHGRHHSGVLYLGGATAMEWEPLGRKGQRIDDVEVFVINTEDGPLIERTVEADSSDPSDPRIVTRSEWVANESLKSTSGGCERQFYPVQQLFVHHTAGSNGDDDPAATMRAIYTYHTQAQGWCDVGYNFVIAADGTIFEGRWARDYSDWETHSSENRSGHAVAGAHVSGYNSGSVGIALMGDFTDAQPTDAARGSLVEMLAWEVDRHDLQATARHTYRNPVTGATKDLPVIAGHRDAGATACPGSTVYKALPQIRKEVVAAVGAGRSNSHLSLTVSAAKVEHGQDVALAGSLTSDGVPLAGRQIVLYGRTGTGGFKEMARLLTSPVGRFDHTFKPERNSVLEVAFPGEPDIWASASGRRKVDVKPLLTLALAKDRLSGTDRSSSSRRVELEGSMTPVVKGSVLIKIFKTKPSGDEVLIKEKAVTMTQGRFGTSYWVRSVGADHRAIAQYRASERLAGGKSAPVFFRVDE